MVFSFLYSVFVLHSCSHSVSANQLIHLLSFLLLFLFFYFSSLFHFFSSLHFSSPLHSLHPFHFFILVLIPSFHPSSFVSFSTITSISNCTYLSITTPLYLIKSIFILACLIGDHLFLSLTHTLVLHDLLSFINNSLSFPFFLTTPQKQKVYKNIVKRQAEISHRRCIRTANTTTFLRWTAAICPPPHKDRLTGERSTHNTLSSSNNSNNNNSISSNSNSNIMTSPDAPPESLLLVRRALLSTPP